MGKLVYGGKKPSDSIDKRLEGFNVRAANKAAIARDAAASVSEELKALKDAASHKQKQKHDSLAKLSSKIKEERAAKAADRETASEWKEGYEESLRSDRGLGDEADAGAGKVNFIDISAPLEYAKALQEYEDSKHLLDAGIRMQDSEGEHDEAYGKEIAATYKKSTDDARARVARLFASIISNKELPSSYIPDEPPFDWEGMVPGDFSAVKERLFKDGKSKSSKPADAKKDGKGKDGKKKLKTVRKHSLGGGSDGKKEE